MRTTTIALVALLGLTLTALDAHASTDPALLCEKAAGTSLVSCVKKVAKLQGKCYAATGAACAADDEKIGKALDKLAKKLAKKCPDDATVQAAGYGPSMTAAALTERLQSECRAETSSLASRTFGGPQGAALAAADDAGKACLQSLLKEGGKLLAGRAKLQNHCVDNERKKGNCDSAKTDAKITALETKEEAKIADACGTPDPARLDDRHRHAGLRRARRRPVALHDRDRPSGSLAAGARLRAARLSRGDAARPVRPRRPRQ